MLLRICYVDVVKPYGTFGGLQHHVKIEDAEKTSRRDDNWGRLESWAAWRGFHAHSMRATCHGAWRCR
jgi:hypothetical protein